MKYFYGSDGVYAYEADGSQDDFILPGLVPMTDAEVKAHIERVSAPLPVSTDIERKWRDAELTALVWLRDRHRDQLEIGVATTLTAEQFSELLVFMQALRDWPQSEAFPDSAQRPVAPPWIADQSQ